jgi:hypothetical protein
MLVLVTATFTSCKKSGFGTFVVSVNNRTSVNYSLGVFIDGARVGSVVALAKTSGFGSCANLDPTLDNVTIITAVASGNHKYEVKEDSSSPRYDVSGDFSMNADDCSTLPVIIN